MSPGVSQAQARRPIPRREMGTDNCVPNAVTCNLTRRPQRGRSGLSPFRAIPISRILEARPFACCELHMFPKGPCFSPSSARVLLAQIAMLEQTKHSEQAEADKVCGPTRG